MLSDNPTHFHHDHHPGMFPQHQAHGSRLLLNQAHLLIHPIRLLYSPRLHQAKRCGRTTPLGHCSVVRKKKRVKGTLFSRHPNPIWGGVPVLSPSFPISYSPSSPRLPVTMGNCVRRTRAAFLPRITSAQEETQSGQRAKARSPTHS